MSIWSKWLKAHMASEGTGKTYGNSPAAKQQNSGPARVQPVLRDNWNFLQQKIGSNFDVIFRRFFLDTKSAEEAMVVYIDNLVDQAALYNNVLAPLMYDSRRSREKTSGSGLEELLLNTMLSAASVTAEQSMDQLVAAILSGGVILLVDGVSNAFIIDISLYDQRSISEPEAEVLVRGPREGFTESLPANLVMIRRRLKSPDLIFETMKIGRISATQVCLAYIQGVAPADLLDEVKERLGRIDIDGILESGYLEEFIEDHPFSPFPQILHTERPDRTAACLLEGRVAIITDGTPLVLIVPVEISVFMTSPEDYYERYIIGTVIRWLRYAAFTLSIVLPSLFIAITSFHQEMIPIRLLISISSFRQGVPFTTLTEAFLMEATFEVLREAGTRLPRSVGSAVSIVGALVIGQAAVQAGLVSPLMVIVVAATGIASFTFPAYNLALTLRLLRFPLMLLAGALGLFGIMFGIIMINIHVARLSSFGLPYLNSLSPGPSTNLKDVLLRAPWWAMNERPLGISRNRRRQSRSFKPLTPNSTSGKEADQQ